MKLQVKRYFPVNPILKRLIKYFWVIHSNCFDINHKYLPVANIDMVINLGPPVTYISGTKKTTISQNLYFNGISDSYKWSVQKKELDIIGISFFTTGFYPLINVPLAGFKNYTILLDQINRNITHEILDRIGQTRTIQEKLAILEAILVRLLDPGKILDDTAMRMFFEFKNTRLTIEEFCSDYGVHKRTLERFFAKYIGASPKSFLKIIRFQKVIKKIESKIYTSLTDLAYDSGYYDQMHFIKDFKMFTGSTPTGYIKHKSSLRDVLDF